jgi:ATP-dependent helicase/nuclease subunit B
MLEHAHEVLARKGRVWWVCLPNQRAYVYRRATQNGAILGLEVLSSQQVYYRLLAHALKLQPLLV